METTYWLKQTKDEPLFPELSWSRPEHKNQAGKLLIVGGNLYGFAAPAEAYNYAVSTGIGTAKVLLPDAVKKIVGPILENGEFAPSTPSGSFNQKALAEVLALAAWSDGVLLAGDLGRNSETAILLEKFLDKYPGQATLTKDAVDYFIGSVKTNFSRPDTTLVLTMAQLQKLGTATKFARAFMFGMDLIALVETLHEFTATYPLQIVVRHLDQLAVAANGQVSTTKVDSEEKVWRVKTASAVSVWWLQNPTKPFEALTASLST